MNKKNLNFDYVAVSSVGKQNDYRSVFKYFNKYLITLGDPTTSPGWNLMSIMKHARNVLVNERIKTAELYVDSGGFQIIVGYIPPSRILEYIECFHIVLDKYHNEIDKIFSLDVNNFKMSATEILEWNEKSTQMTINSIQKFPVLKDKVFFIVQNRNEKVFEIWRKLFIEKEVYKHFNLYSFGGLVGLKKDTNAVFNHAVPATMWLLTYQKHFNFDIKQLHWLGQSSRVVFIAIALIERLFKIYVTADSSEIVRFAPIASKLPMLCKTVSYCEETHKPIVDFDFARVPKDILSMLEFHSWDDDHCPRVSRDNLKLWNIDIDVLHSVPQDLFDYIFYLMYKNTGNEENIIEYKDHATKLLDQLNRICNNKKLFKSDLEFFINNISDETIDLYNIHLTFTDEEFSQLTNISPESKGFVIEIRNLINKLKNFKYVKKRSLQAIESFKKTNLTKLANCDFIELSCQNIDSAITLSDPISEKILEIGLENCTIENLKEIHPTMHQGHTAKTTLANIKWILKFLPVIEKGDINQADEFMREIVKGYVK